MFRAGMFRTGMFRTGPNFRIVFVQTVITLAVALGAFWFSYHEALGALYAGTALVIPNAFFAWRCQVEKEPARVLVAGVVRWYASVGLMAAAIVVLKPPAAGFFTALILCQGAYFFANKRDITGNERTN